MQHPPLRFVAESYDAQNRRVLGSDGSTVIHLRTIRGAMKRARRFPWHPAAVCFTLAIWPDAQRYNESAARRVGECAIRGNTLPPSAEVGVGHWRDYVQPWSCRG